MSLTPWNRQEEWYQQMINASTGNYLPSITAQDEGKVLTVESDGSWGVENVPSELPTVTASDAGKVLAVDDSGVWGASEPIGKKFIVTLTPTAEDFSGTMDKTIAEINAAYEAGQQIVFRVMISATTYMDVDCTARWFGGDTYPSFNCSIIDDENNILIFAGTGATNDGTQTTYSTAIYTLTPAT